MSSKEPFGIGDFVEIIESQEEEARKRGYILRPHQQGAETLSIFDVVLDEARYAPPPNELNFSAQSPARMICVPAQNLKLHEGIHGQGV